MAPTPPPPPPSSEEHQQLLDNLDIARLPRTFRSRTWKPSQRRNKNIKQIITEASRKEASLIPPTTTTTDNSGTSTPLPLPPAQSQNNLSSTANNGNLQPPNGSTQNGIRNGAAQSNISQAAQNLSSLALSPIPTPNSTTIISTYPSATYTNIESAPSLHPGHQRHYCDITGLPAPYTDPKTRLRYHNKEVFSVVRGLGQGVAEQYLEARGAHTVLK
ncbi:MAG: hypothetical protein M1812_002498 [Candelaria pacifica]|nr:MAG: hypothetical protein M1812_002498 [Candelaria pacifica]